MRGDGVASGEMAADGAMTLSPQSSREYRTHTEMLTGGHSQKLGVFFLEVVFLI